jgi:hypothetical protein
VYLFFDKGKKYHGFCPAPPNNMSTRKCVKWTNVTSFDNCGQRICPMNKNLHWKGPSEDVWNELSASFFDNCDQGTFNKILMVALVCYLRKERSWPWHILWNARIGMQIMQIWQNWFHLHQFCWQHIRGDSRIFGKHVYGCNWNWQEIDI